MGGQPLRVLIVDDQPAVVEALELLLELHDIPHLSAGSPSQALKIAARETLGAAVQDMNFERSETGGEAGISLFRALRSAQPDLPVLLMTAWASLETAVRLVKEGASDYLEKPWDDDRLVATLNRLVAERSAALEDERRRAERALSRAELTRRYDLRGFVYASEAMHRLLSLATHVARSEAPILITGPSGSGKERIAEIVQANSSRKAAPFVKVNLGAVPEELFEAELFGAEAGAYTGLNRRRIGHFESAAGGTLFLDEIDSLPLAGQVKLLRVLQSGEFQRLGHSDVRRADVRVIAATNSDLQTAIAAGEFREDLYFRLNVVELALPPLDERREDVLPLARHFLGTFHDPRLGPPGELSPEALESLAAYDWPGNVRELENRIRRGLLMAKEGEISATDLGLAESAPTGGRVAVLGAGELEEREQVVTALRRARGTVARAAEALGISRQALYRKMTRLGIRLEREPRS